MNDDAQHHDNRADNDIHPDGYGEVLGQLLTPTTIDHQLRDRQIATAIAAARSDPAPSTGPVVELEPRRRRRPLLTGALAAAAAAIIIGAIGISVRDSSNQSSNDIAGAPSGTERSRSDSADSSTSADSSSAEQETAEPGAASAGASAATPPIGDLGYFTDVAELRSAATARRQADSQVEATPASRDDKVAGASGGTQQSVPAGRCDAVTIGTARWSATLNGLAVIVTVDEQGVIAVLNAANCTTVDGPRPG